MKVMRQVMVAVGIIALCASMAVAQTDSGTYVVGPQGGGNRPGMGGGGMMGPGGPGGMRGPGMMELAGHLDDFWTNPRVIEKLGLTDDQVEQLEAISVERQKFQIQHRGDAELLRLELEQLWKADTLDESAILNKVQAMSKLHEEAAVEIAKYRIQVHNILTPQQREQVKTAIKHRVGERLERWRQGGRGDSPRKGSGPRGNWNQQDAE